MLPTARRCALCIDNRLPARNIKPGYHCGMKRLFLLVLMSMVFPGVVTCGGDDGPDNGAGVGNRCSENDDCKTKNCYLGPGGGYCTTTCATEGSMSECPEDTVCKPIQGGARRCLLICGSDSSCGKDECDNNFCPRGSACVSVSNATVRACEPQPE